MLQKRLFVAMPYGKRKALLDSEKPDTTVEIDFDEVWTGILQPAIPTEYETKRADELRQPGLIDRLYNEWLYESDIVLADLTFGNPNVYYELGIRQALSSKGTVLVCCQGTRLPFDVRNQYVIYYDYFSATSLHRFQQQLRQAIETAAIQRVDSPVHVFLPGLNVTRNILGFQPDQIIASLEARLAEANASLKLHSSLASDERLARKIEDANTPGRVRSLLPLIISNPTSSIRLLELIAIKLRKFAFIDEAIDVLSQCINSNPRDPELLRELGFCYRKKGPQFYSSAETCMCQALEINDEDVELHGMYGGLLKRRHAFGEALIHYRRAFELDPTNLYPLVNLGAIHAALGNLEEAKRWYRIVDQRCEELIVRNNYDYWTYLCQAEAQVATGNGNLARISLIRARDAGAPPEDLYSEIEQLEFFITINFEPEQARKALVADAQ